MTRKYNLNFLQLRDKLVALYDNELEFNLSHLSTGFSKYGPDGITVHYRQLPAYLQEVGFEPLLMQYSSLISNGLTGIYPITVVCDAAWWLGVESHRGCILHDIPKEIIAAARNKQITILIDNSSEGLPLRHGRFDGFRILHDSMSYLGLGKNSVCIMNGDGRFNEIYRQWCEENNEERLLTHVSATTWPWIFENKIPTTPLILDALANDSKDFNSLNRTARIHRREHLFWLIENNLLSKGLVSGSWTNNNEPTQDLFPRFLDIDRTYFAETLIKNLPVEVDGNWILNNPDDSETHIFNHDIYRNSLVSVVTETHFVSQCTFLTEKIFKPIVAGHPFILLGTYKSLEFLRSKGYRTDFDMFDDSYDNIISNSERFTAVHSQLFKWTQLSKEEKEKSIMKSMDAIVHNQELFRSKDHVKESFLDLATHIKKIYKK